MEDMEKKEVGQSDRLAVGLFLCNLYSLPPPLFFVILVFLGVLLPFFFVYLTISSVFFYCVCIYQIAHNCAIRPCNLLILCYCM